MKAERLVGLALISGALVTPLIATGESWETVFTFSAPGQTQGYSILLDPFSNDSSPRRIFVGALRLDVTLQDPWVGSTNRLFVFDRVTGTYETSDAFSDTLSVRLGFDPVSRSLYARSESRTGWQVRKSTDSGASWTLVDTFELPTKKPLEPKGFAADDQGNVFVGGFNFDPAVSFIRKSSDQGQTWSTVDSLTNVTVARLHFVPGASGGLFAVGERISGSGGSTTYAWIIRRSRDAGATWKTVHTYAGSGNVGANAITSDPQGIIYVAGWGTPEVVKSSNDGGDTWQTIHTNPQSTSIDSMAADAAGNLFLAGGSAAGGSVLRRNASGVWEDISPNPDSGSNLVIGADRVGNIFAAGSLQNPGSEAAVSLVVEQFLVALPKLKAVRSGDTLLVSWSASISGAQLESTCTLDSGANWLPVTTAPVVVGDEQTVTVDATGSPAQFFRLHKP